MSQNSVDSAAKEEYSALYDVLNLYGAPNVFKKLNEVRHVQHGI